MSSRKESFDQISPSEFFYRNRDLAGFSNPTRSLYTAVREFVENALDACDHAGILPDVHLTIKAVDPEKPVDGNSKQATTRRRQGSLSAFSTTP